MNKPTKNDETSVSSRRIAVNILLAVLKEGKSLSSLSHLTEGLDVRDAAFARMLSFGVLRYFDQLQAMLVPFIKKPLKAKDLDVQLVILLALYQILHTRVPDFAAVDVAVKQIRKSRKQWAAKMINGVLRNFLRQIEGTEPDDVIAALKTESGQFAHPQWIINGLKKDWPDQWQSILIENNKQAPMTLRINQLQSDLNEYQCVLENSVELKSKKISNMPSALKLEQPADVVQLPGFNKGWFSVQDAGAQLAAQILQPQADDIILDACAAPGGKTAHLFELQPTIKVTALDISETRLQRVTENCQRLGFKPTLIAADACATDEWWQGEMFDKILLDVPCSAIGVIRRHPDIKHLRREEDIDNLVQLQREILLKNWALLKPGGLLLYVTCSVFKAENEQQVTWFLQQQKQAESVELSYARDWLSNDRLKIDNCGMQLFPTENHDGFYYALLRKKSI